MPGLDDFPGADHVGRELDDVSSPGVFKPFPDYFARVMDSSSPGHDIPGLKLLSSSSVSRVLLVAVVAAIDRRMGGVAQLVSLKGVVVSVPPLLPGGESYVASIDLIDLMGFSIFLLVETEKAEIFRGPCPCFSDGHNRRAIHCPMLFASTVMAGEGGPSGRGVGVSR